MKIQEFINIGQEHEGFVINSSDTFDPEDSEYCGDVEVADMKFQYAEHYGDRLIFRNAVDCGELSIDMSCITELEKSSNTDVYRLFTKGQQLITVTFLIGKDVE